MHVFSILAPRGANGARGASFFALRAGFWSSGGIVRLGMNGSRNESTVRKMARGKINFAWEWHKFIRNLLKNMHKSLILTFRGAKRPRGVSLFAPSGSLGQPRGASGSLGGPSTTTTHLDITVPPPHHAQEKNTS